MTDLLVDRAVQHNSPHKPKRRWPLRLVVVVVILALIAAVAGLYSGRITPLGSKGAAVAGAQYDPVVIGAVPYWDEAEARLAVETHAGKLDVASPWSYAVAKDGSVVLQPDLDAAGEASQATWLHDRGLKVVPSIANTTDGIWDPNTIARVINDPAMRAKHVASIVEMVEAKDYDGIQIDYEDLSAKDREAFSAFVTDLARDLHGAGKLLYVTVHAKETDAGYDGRNEAQDYAAIAKAADMICLMAYDWHWSTGPAGPIAPYDWVERVIRYAVTQVPAEQIILGVGLFGYDWVGTQATNLTWRQVVALAGRYPSAELWDVGGQSPHFSYVDSDGKNHEVWYENGRSATTKFDLARRYGLGGIELWRLGQEDPSVWEPGP